MSQEDQVGISVAMRTVGIAATLSLALGCALPLMGGARIPADPSGLTDSSLLSSRPAVSGVVMDEQGNPSKSGVVVQLVVTPSEAELARMKVGDERPVEVVGYARTDGEGRFVLRISDEEAARSHADPRGNVDYELISSVDGNTSVRAISLAAPGSPGSRQSSEGGEPSSLADIELVPNLDGAPDSASTRASVAGGSVVPMAGCVKVFSKSLGQKRVTVGRGSTVSGAKMSFTYTSGSSSTLGVGYSTSGTSGSWSQSGTHSISVSNEVEFETVLSGSVEFKTNFVYGKYQTVCTGWGYYTVQATSHAGGSYPLGVGVISVNTSTNCVEHTGGSFTKYTSTASEFSSGVGIVGAIGISLSSKSGYTSATKIKFTFTGKKRLCGKNGLPGGSPGLLRAMNL